MGKILVLDFGGQYCHLIARRIRDLGVYSEVVPSSLKKEELLQMAGVKGIILSGGAASVYDVNAPGYDKNILQANIPVLGICYGHQLLAFIDGGDVKEGEKGEYGVSDLKILETSRLFEGIFGEEKVWMNHRDIVLSLPDSYSIIAATKDCPIAAFADEERNIYGVQFHPEVSHTKMGVKILENFVFKICNAGKSWEASSIIERITSEINQKIGKKKAILGLSGGVDSSTAAILVSNAVGKNLIAVYVDTGLMRVGETNFLKKEFSGYSLNLKVINAEERFFKELKGVAEPEEKRKIIGRVFIEIFNEIAEQEKVNMLVQGTIYSDRIESGASIHSSKIKSHHNVGGLPEQMKLEVYEPLRELYKDEVRAIAKILGVSDAIIDRHVFPGPGFAIRILGEVTKEKAEIVRRATLIIEEELKNTGLYDKVWMAFAVLLPIKSVGIQGDARSYKYPIVVRIIESKDAMTASFAHVPYFILEKISTRITNEISEVNRVVYDISHKPPATMEWE